MTFEDKVFEKIHELCKPDVLEVLCPEIKGYNDVAKQIGDMQELDSPHIGKFTKTTGMWSGGAGQKIGWCPERLYVAIESICPGFFSDKRLRNRFLRENPQFLYKRKVH